LVRTGYREGAQVSDFRARYGQWAVVAGASSGLGAEFGTQLAARGLDVLLLARRKELTEQLAAQLAAKHKVRARAAAVDLGAPDLLQQLRAATDGLEIGLVVYNAAQSLIGPFLEQTLDEKLRILDVNCRGPLIFADELGRQMAARGRGGIVIMASLAAAQGSPLVATYAASKAFDLVLAEGLWDELGARGVDVLACRAGATRTPNYEAAKPVGKVPLMEAAPVVTLALDSLGKRPSVVPGFINRLGDVVMGRLLSRRAAIRLMSRTTRRLYPDRDDLRKLNGA
jgi:short-subunit dehydrogenase